MMKQSLFTFLLFVSALLSVDAIADKGVDLKKLSKQDWIQVDSKNFSIVSNEKAKKVEAIALQLEEFRYFVSQFMGLKQVDGLAPVRFIVFKSGSTYDKMMFKKNIAGIFSAKPSGFISVADGDDFNISQTRSSWGRHVIFHEMVHYFTYNQAADTQYPLWFSEGIAEYLGTMKYFGDKLTFGDMSVLKNRFYFLRRASGECCHSVDVGTLFKAKTRSSAKSSKKRRKEMNMFYARAFATVHYLNASKARRAVLNKYLSLVNTGVGVDDAFQQSFNKSYDDLSDEIDDYITGNKVYGRAFAVGEGGFEFPEFKIDSKQLQTEQALYRILDVTLSFGGSVYSEKFSRSKTVDGYLEMYPDSAFGTLLEARHNSSVSTSDKISKLKTLLESDPNNAAALERLGDQYLNLANMNRRTANKSWKDDVAQARGAYRSAISQNFFAGGAYNGLVKSYRYTPYDDIDYELLSLSLEAVRLFVERSSVHRLEALLRTGAGDFDAAEKSYTRYVDTTDGSWSDGYATWVRDGLRLLKFKDQPRQSEDSNSILYADGSFYKGQTVDGFPDGEGEFSSASGIKYSGQWRAGLPHGSGKFIATNGMTYQGQFENGAVHGEGSLDYKSLSLFTSKYTGSFYNFMEQGVGELETPEGLISTGNFTKGYRNGQHVLKRPSGEELVVDYVWGDVSITSDDESYIGSVDLATMTPKGWGYCKATDTAKYSRCDRSVKSKD